MILRKKVKFDPPIISSKQLADDLNRPDAFIHHKKKGELNLVYPFPHKDGDGPVFILKDDALKRFKKKYKR